MAEYIYGKNTVIEILKSNHKVEEVLLTEQVWNSDKLIASLIKDNVVSYKIVEKNSLNKFVDGNHQGIVAKIAPFNYFEVDDILRVAQKRNEPPFIVILDGLEDPHNLGAILRTADAAGVHGVIIPKNRSVSLNATVAKLSTGAIEHVKVAKVTNLNNTIKELKKNGLWIVGTDADTNIDYRQMDGKSPIALVIGSEGKGVSRLVKENCDLIVKLPMKGHVTSLNASVATSIFMYEVLNQRNPL
jgi:23S rRNA (guanosine2251-2'-O)-methyltransferase